ncbi:MAG TPA: poly-beta-1,6-N-acetyl-D-glucosamine synthase [Clostridia bacterium]|nr:poly-beta-1,6-N-acetyl-D-glucosamine synthase [Clostridia bacterium]
MPLIISSIGNFVFWYPLIMSTVWIVGGVLFYFRIERKEPLPLKETPMVSIIVPCFNEEDTIEETAKNLDELNYPNYEVIAVNDGSRDQTGEMLRKLFEKYDRLRAIDLKQNSGKANALYLGLLASRGEIIVGIDADAILDKDSLRYIVPHFTLTGVGERVGAVTGNPRVRNRSSLLARVQLCEFSSIIGLIKRTQRMLGKVMTVSGVIAAYRKSALYDCKLWDRDTITEDIGVTWKLQKRFWDVRYEPRAICWMLVPETIKGFWKQRVRWAQGGMEALLRHWDIFLDWKQRRIIPIYLEELISVIWSFCWAFTVFLAGVEFILGKSNVVPILWSGSYLSLICVIQFFFAMLIDSKYDHDLMRYYLWSVWYPTFYWYFNALVILRAVPKALSQKRKGKFAIWDSPDRGLGG